MSVLWIGRGLFCAVVTLITGCQPTVEPETAAGASPAPLWNIDGLDAQPRMAELRARTPAELQYKPATTPWRPAEAPVPASFTPEGIALRPGQITSPGVLLQQLALEMDLAVQLGETVWEQVTRVWLEEPESAVAVIMEWGFQDDAVAGRDLRVHMRRGAAGWAATAIEERLHCRRGIAEGLCL